MAALLRDAAGKVAPLGAQLLLHLAWTQGAILGRDKVGLKFNIHSDKLAEVRTQMRWEGGKGVACMAA